jgi:hypothetical protein
VNAFHTAEQLLAAAGRDLGSSGWVEIDAARREQFALAARDGTDGVPAFLVLSLAAASLNELFDVPGATFAMNYGLDDVRFGPPVPVGGRVRLRARIADVSARREGAVDVALDVVVERDGAGDDGAIEPACTARQLARFQFARMPSDPSPSEGAPS